MKSNKKVLELKDIILPFKKVFPITIEGSINGENYYFKKDEESTLTFSQYEALMHSSYAKYLEN